MSYFEKLDEPKVIELDSEMKLVIATEVNFIDLHNGIVSFRGKSYDYEGYGDKEDGDLEYTGCKEVVYDMKQNGYLEVDEHGKMID